MMKKILAISISILLLSFHTVKSKEIYVGIDYLNTKIDSGVTNISSNLDEKDSGYSLYAGLPIDKNLDLEISYNDFGEASLSGVSGNQFIFDGTTYQFITTASLSFTCYLLLLLLPVHRVVGLFVDCSHSVFLRINQTFRSSSFRILCHVCRYQNTKNKKYTDRPWHVATLNIL